MEQDRAERSPFRLEAMYVNLRRVRNHAPFLAMAGSILKALRCDIFTVGRGNPAVPSPEAGLVDP